MMTVSGEIERTRKKFVVKYNPAIRIGAQRESTNNVDPYIRPEDDGFILNPLLH
jgi:hypothetical protein